MAAMNTQEILPVTKGTHHATHSHYHSGAKSLIKEYLDQILMDRKESNVRDELRKSIFNYSPRVPV